MIGLFVCRVFFLVGVVEKGLTVLRRFALIPRQARNDGSNVSAALIWLEKYTPSIISTEAERSGEIKAKPQDN